MADEWLQRQPAGMGPSSWLDKGVQMLQDELDRSIRERSRQLIEASQEAKLNCDSRYQHYSSLRQGLPAAAGRVRLKCHYNSMIRIVNVTTDQTESFRKLLSRLSSDYGFQVQLMYEDVEGDLITLGSQNDLNELIESAKTNESIVVHVKQSPLLRKASSGGGGAGDRDQTAILQSPTPNRSAVATQLRPLAPLLPPSPPSSSPSPAPSHVNAPAKNFDSVSGSLLLCPTRKQTLAVADRGGVSFRWQRGEAIGRGGFGTVYLGLNLDSGELMAVKQLDTKDVSARELEDIENELKLLARTTRAAPRTSHNQTKSDDDGDGDGDDDDDDNDNKGDIVGDNDDDDDDDDEDKDSATLARLNHPNIVQYLGMERPTPDILCIFLEYVPGGSLRKHINRFGALPEPLVRVYTRQLLLGLEYLHANGIAHRDIKGANVLITNDGVIKLADFGASKRSSCTMSFTSGQGLQGALTSSRGSTASSNSSLGGSLGSGLKGTPLWMAPEIIKQSKLDVVGWQRADIWSTACTIVEMATGKPPWSGFNNPLTAMYHIAMVKTMPDIPEHLSDVGKTFLTRCFSRQAELRPTATELLLDPFLTKLPRTKKKRVSKKKRKGGGRAMLQVSSSSPMLSPVQPPGARRLKQSASSVKMPPLSPILAPTRRGDRSIVRHCDEALSSYVGKGNEVPSLTTATLHETTSGKGGSPGGIRKRMPTSPLRRVVSLKKPPLSQLFVPSSRSSPFVRKMPWQRSRSSSKESSDIAVLTPEGVAARSAARPSPAGGAGGGGAVVNDAKFPDPQSAWSETGDADTEVMVSARSSCGMDKHRAREIFGLRGFDGSGGDTQQLSHGIDHMPSTSSPKLEAVSWSPALRQDHL